MFRLIGVAAAGVLVLAACGGSSASSAALDQYVEALNAGDTDAIAAITAPDSEAREWGTLMASCITDLPTQFGVEEFTDVTVDDDDLITEATFQGEPFSSLYSKAFGEEDVNNGADVRGAVTFRGSALNGSTRWYEVYFSNTGSAGFENVAITQFISDGRTYDVFLDSSTLGAGLMFKGCLGIPQSYPTAGTFTVEFLVNGGLYRIEALVF